MLRSLIVFVIPATALLATNMPPLAKNGFLGAQDQLSVEKVPIAPATPEPAQDDGLAALLAAAKGGDLDSQAALGVMYYWGRGIDQDFGEAKKWLTLAGERGHRDAQAKLGAMCFLGQGGTADEAEAILWFLKAADQGEPYSQGCIGVMYAVGEGLPKDLMQAYIWLYQAQEGGDTDAAEPFRQVKSRLTPTQVEEAERRARAAMSRRASN
jgi:TPR repeat protein